MDLTPSQLFSLDEMGIPVWGLRSESSSETVAEFTEQSLQGECLVIVESHNNDQQTQRLLHAMLFSIGLRDKQYTVISSDQLAQIQHGSVQQKRLLVLGEELAQSLWGKSVIRGKSHQALGNSISAVVSFSLEQLLTSPEDKALAWRDLQLLKNILNAV